jgi:hypothetical protein
MVKQLCGNTNILIKGNNTWRFCGKIESFYSPDKGASWTVLTLQLFKKDDGIFTADFYDAKIDLLRRL